MSNTYSAQWFDLFLRPISAQQTEREVKFICRQLPRPRFQSVLDICCGDGRHSLALARRGYEVTGVDRDEIALQTARSRANDAAQFIPCDMRELVKLRGPFEAAICMW